MTTQPTDLDPMALVSLDELRDTLGRKLQGSDLADGGVLGEVLYDLACAWLPSQVDADFAWLADRAQEYTRGGGLNDRQAAGVLNCLYAERHRDGRGGGNRGAGPVRPEVLDIPSGYLTVLFGDNSHRTLRLSDWQEDKRNPGRQIRWINLLVGPDNAADYAGCAMQRDDGSLLFLRDYQSDGMLRQAVELVVDPEHDSARGNAREAYAMRSGRCANCNRMLTVPASLHRGLGPDCAAKLGLDDADDGVPEGWEDDHPDYDPDDPNEPPF